MITPTTGSPNTASSGSSTASAESLLPAQGRELSATVRSVASSGQNGEVFKVPVRPTGTGRPRHPATHQQRRTSNSIAAHCTIDRCDRHISRHHQHTAADRCQRQHAASAVAAHEYTSHGCYHRLRPAPGAAVEPPRITPNHSCHSRYVRNRSSHPDRLFTWHIRCACQRRGSTVPTTRCDNARKAPDKRRTVTVCADTGFNP